MPKINASNQQKYKLLKIPLIILGTISLVIGVVGIVVPGLPTTTFLLISAACYIRSSEKLYNWLIDHKVLGKFIQDYQLYKAIPRKSKIIAFFSMWIMISISIIFFIDKLLIDIIVGLCGIIGTLVLLKVKTLETK